MEPKPFWGEGQGSGDAMPRWSVCSDNLIRVYIKQGHHAKYIAPISGITELESILAFVDNSTLAATQRDLNMSLEENYGT